MKKTILFGAALAALATFNSCSEDEDLVAQEPIVPEEPAVVKGTPFTVSAFGGDDTRAVRYGNGGKEINDGDGWIQEIKIYGVQTISQNSKNPWLQSVVFKRTDKESTVWTPARDNGGNPISSITWPTSNTDKPTTFYGITDGNIATGANNQMNGVTPGFAEGKIDYLPVPTTISPYADGFLMNDSYEFVAYTANGSYGEGSGWVNPADATATASEFDVVDNEKLGDLMVATKESTETADGSIPLSFEHILCGLYVSAKFCPQDQKWVAATDKSHYFTIIGVRLHGLYTSGTYTFGSGWDSLGGASGSFYYGLGRADGSGNFNENWVTLEAEATTTTPTIKNVVPSGTWLIIPQTVTGWDCKWKGSAGLPASGAYLEILYTNGDMDPLTGYVGTALYPLPNKTFEAGHNYHLVIDVEKVRTSLTDNYSDNGDSGEDDNNDYIFQPTKGGGQG